jgi:hypothetical protein
MSRKPKTHTLGEANQPPNMVLGDEPPIPVYTKRAQASPPVPGRSVPHPGSCNQLGDQVGDVRPRHTAGIDEGVEVGPRGTGASPSAAYGTLTYEQRQARARRGR